MQRRPVVGGMTVPYVVDPTNAPIQFATLQPGRVTKCAIQRRCGICGRYLPRGQDIAFVGPDDGRRCFADVWMDVACARQAMAQCPFLKGRGWKRPEDAANPVLAPYTDVPQRLFLASNGRAHRDHFGHWHFEALGVLRRG